MMDMYTVRHDLDEISAKTKNTNNFLTLIRNEVVVLDQGEIWWRHTSSSPRPNVKIDVVNGFIAQVAIHLEILPKHDSIHKTSQYEKY